MNELLPLSNNRSEIDARIFVYIKTFLRTRAWAGQLQNTRRLCNPQCCRCFSDLHSHLSACALSASDKLKMNISPERAIASKLFLSETTTQEAAVSNELTPYLGKYPSDRSSGRSGPNSDTLKSPSQLCGNGCRGWRI
jgi:hypothetical protein